MNTFNKPLTSNEVDLEAVYEGVKYFILTTSSFEKFVFVPTGEDRSPTMMFSKDCPI